MVMGLRNINAKGIIITTLVHDSTSSGSASAATSRLPLPPSMSIHSGEEHGTASGIHEEDCCPQTKMTSYSTTSYELDEVQCSAAVQ